MLTPKRNRPGLRLPIKLIPALRYDTFDYDVDGTSSDGGQASPKLALNVAASDRSISPARGYEILANPNLDPETVTTIELGFAYRSRMGSDGFSVKGAYYSSAGDDFIDIPMSVPATAA